MRLSHYLLATEKEVPKDADLISHQLMIRAGLIRKVASGVYTWLPLGWRVLQKVMTVIRDEMNKTGALEILMPNTIPSELWQESGRWDKYGPELLRFQDRHERDFCFGPTHEEVVTDLARRELKSYKQLPVNVYQIQIKFRDEIRPRFGVMRGREFCMKDAYSFDIDQESLNQSYQKMYDAYVKIFTRLGIDFRPVEADTGAIGGDFSHEFQALADAGEDLIFYSDKSDYAANIEQATSLAPQGKRPEPKVVLTKFSTPDAKTIQALAEQFDVPAHTSVKTLVAKNDQDQFFAFIVRGDHELNEIKASKTPGMQHSFVMATEAEIVENFGAHPGSLGPVNCPIPLLVDRDAAILADFVAGANEDGVHYKGINWDRDVKDYQVFDLRNVVEGDASPDGQGVLKSARGIEVGQVFQLQDKYSKAMGMTVLNEKGENVTPLMGCYGIGVTRTIAAAIEQHHDGRGIIWPEGMAPFQVALVPIRYHEDAKVREVADQLYNDLLAKGVEVVIDDRDERPGVKFADLDLIGIPHRVVVSEKHLANSVLEYKNRSAAEPELLEEGQVLAKLRSYIHKRIRIY